MNLLERINAFSSLGKLLEEYLVSKLEQPEIKKILDSGVQKAGLENHWFTPGNITLALRQTAFSLQDANLMEWVKLYPELIEIRPVKRIGIIAAGNIPLVGFHDLLCVLISGHSALIKTSSKDDALMKTLVHLLILQDPRFNERIHFTTGILNNFDAIIATGSNNSARYFSSYFGKYPHIIRKNRNAIALLKGNENPAELGLLGDDIFQYFGLGCRNVSKLYLPHGYNLHSFYEAMERWNSVIHHHHYANNYEYHRAIYLVNKVALFDNGFLLLKEDEAIASPVSVLFYEYYESENDLAQKIDKRLDEIQCIVSSHWTRHPCILPGQAQKPGLNDYADGIDTMQFLLSLK